MIDKLRAKEYEKQVRENLEDSLAEAAKVVEEAQEKAYNIRLEAWKVYQQFLRITRQEREAPQFLAYREGDAFACVVKAERQVFPTHSIFATGGGSLAEPFLSAVEHDVLLAFRELRRPLTVKGVFEHMDNRYGQDSIRKALNSLEKNNLLSLRRGKSNRFLYSLQIFSSSADPSKTVEMEPKG